VAAAEAILFDLDGVLLDTAIVHRRAWADLFTAYFAQTGVSPAYTDADYLAYLDGRPRYDGVQAVLASRGVTLPWGEASDPPDRPTVCGLGNAKNQAFQAALAGGVTAFPETVSVLLGLLRAGHRLAVVSSSRNAQTVLAAAGLTPAFQAIVDGETAREQHLAGKPAPDLFTYAAALLQVAPTAAVVVEDALAGVAAGRAGGFGLVIGVDRSFTVDLFGEYAEKIDSETSYPISGGLAADLRRAGADVVIQTLSALVRQLGQGTVPLSHCFSSPDLAATSLTSGAKPANGRADD
jgi:beta-phosphoglucomutase family hydrolase